MEPWCRGLTCLPVTQETAGSNPVGSAIFDKVQYEPLAQLVEHLTFNQGVVGSSPTWLTFLLLQSLAEVAQG